jgi:hypothetical protein
MDENESGIWYVMTTVVIMYFLFRISHIFIIVTTERCASQEAVWFTSDDMGINIYVLFVAVFVLIGCWAISETLRAFVLHYQDRFLCLLITVLISLAVASVLIISRAQYESYQVIYGSRPYNDYNFNIIKHFKPVLDINGVQLDGKYRWLQCQKANK